MTASVAFRYGIQEAKCKPLSSVILMWLFIKLFAASLTLQEECGKPRSWPWDLEFVGSTEPGRAEDICKPEKNEEHLTCFRFCVHDFNGT